MYQFIIRNNTVTIASMLQALNVFIINSQNGKYVLYARILCYYYLCNTMRGIIFFVDSIAITNAKLAKLKHEPKQ